MSKAIILRRSGGPEVLQLEDISVPEPREGEAVIRHTAIGVNFIDTYQRSGLYKIPLPGGLGSEAAGVVEAIGKNVSYVKPGDRVAYAGGAPGSYCEVRTFPAERLLKIPDGVTDIQAASMMLKGMTAQYLIRQTYRAKAGETVLFHAAAGGVGLIACQWLRSLGVHVIGTVSSEEKAQLAKQNGCEHVIIYTKENFVERVREITNGKGVPVVYDSVGKDTFEGSLDCLQPKGLFVTYGNASGPIPAFEPAILSQKGSLYMTRPTLVTYTSSRLELEKTAQELFEIVGSGSVSLKINDSYLLKDVAQVHRDLEGRRTTGSIVMKP